MIDYEPSFSCQYCGCSTYPVGRYRYCMTPHCPNENRDGIEEWSDIEFIRANELWESCEWGFCEEEYEELRRTEAETAEQSQRLDQSYAMLPF
jgi:hypothetical protein